MYLNAGRTKPLDTLTGDPWVRVDHPGKHAAYARIQQRVSTRWRTTEVAARLQIHVHICATGELAGGSKRDHFCVWSTHTFVMAEGHKRPIAYNHRPHHRVWAGGVTTKRSLLQCEAHPLWVAGHLARS